MPVRHSIRKGSRVTTEHRQQKACAFFDFDETLVEQKSMFSFLKYYTATERAIEQSFEEIMDEIRIKKEGGASREDINSFYYSLFINHSREEFCRAAKDFVSGGGITPKALVLDRMNEHRRQGDAVIVVSGASRDIIDPVLQSWGVSEALCAEQETCGERYTGRLAARAIGRHKAERLTRYCQERGVAPSLCFAYGDDISDAPMLSAVGHPVAVDPGPDLLELARHRGWEILITTEGFCR